MLQALINEMKTKTATTVRDAGNGNIGLTYHQTEVVFIDFGNNEIKLRTGGWKTVTTKARMNAALQKFYEETGISIAVYQRNFEWYVQREGYDPEHFEGDNFTIKY